MQPQSIQQFEDDYGRKLQSVAAQENKRCVGTGFLGGSLPALSKTAQQVQCALTNKPQGVDDFRRQVPEVGRDNVRVALNRLVLNGLAKQVRKGRNVYWVKA